MEGKAKKKYGENCRYELDQYHECRKKLKELFPDGIIPKIKDLQDELKKAREDYAKMSAERKALKKEADRLSRLAQQKRDSQRTLTRYMENEQAAKPLPTDWTSFGQLYGEWKSKNITGRDFMRRMGLSANTFYRRVREYEITHHITEHTTV